MKEIENSHGEGFTLENISSLITFELSPSSEVYIAHFVVCVPSFSLCIFFFFFNLFGGCYEINNWREKIKTVHVQKNSNIIDKNNQQHMH